MANPALSALHREEKSLSILNPGTENLTMESILGKGTFGLVVKCRRASDLSHVAVKMLKRTSSNIRAIEAEVSMLEEVRRLDPDKCNLVRWYRAFEIPGHACLEFESLDKSLLDFMKERWFRPLELEAISSIVQQASTALDHLKSLDIIHADLKPANIMLVDQRLQPYKVKVIDFGLAHKMSTARQGCCIQTLPYRAPEIMLALPYTTAVDVWSLGCITAFLYLGAVLYPSYSQYEMLRYIVQTQGQPPGILLDMGEATGQYFTKNSSSKYWRLKNLQEYFGERACLFQDNRTTVLTSLDDFLHVRPNHRSSQIDSEAHRANVAMFVDLLKGLLQLNAVQRLTPCEVVRHPFITGCHFAMQNPSAPARSTQERAKVCSQKCSSGNRPQQSGWYRGRRCQAHLSPARKETSEAKRKRPCVSKQHTTLSQQLVFTQKGKMTEDSDSHERPKKRDRWD